MRVAAADDEPLAGEPRFLLQPTGDFFDHRTGDRGVVDRDEDGEVFVFTEGEGLGEDMLLNADGLGLAGGVAAEADGVVGGDVGFGDADGDGLSQRGKKSNEKRRGDETS